MSLCPSCRSALRRTLWTRLLIPNTPRQRVFSTPASTVQAILSKPTWSVRQSLLSATDIISADATTITPAMLRHLLRLSALPPPKTPEEEASMIKTLQSQLQFVRAVQSVNTEGVEPLTAIRDETAQGLVENTVTLGTLHPALAKETLVGHHKRPKRARDQQREASKEGRVREERWDVLGTASRKAGKFFVVQSKKSS